MRSISDSRYSQVRRKVLEWCWTVELRVCYVWTCYPWMDCWVCLEYVILGIGLHWSQVQICQKYIIINVNWKNNSQKQQFSQLILYFVRDSTNTGMRAIIKKNFYKEFLRTRYNIYKSREQRVLANINCILIYHCWILFDLFYSNWSDLKDNLKDRLSFFFQLLLFVKS